MLLRVDANVSVVALAELLFSCFVTVQQQRKQPAFPLFIIQN